MPDSNHTTDHDEIREWIEMNEGMPSVARSVQDGITDLLHVDFGDGEDNLMEVSWAEFFRIFDENNLAFIYTETDTEDESGKKTYKFVSRDDEDAFDVFEEEEDDVEEDEYE